MEIAVVGMAGRFPGAGDVDAYWDNLCRGIDAISSFSDHQLRAAGVPEDLLARPDCVKARGVVDEVELFDAELFGYNPRQAELTDPQQRLLLEAAFTALEDAGYGAPGNAAAVGVFAGAGATDYLRDLPAAERPDRLTLSLGNERDFLAQRIAYKLDLQGPAVTVQTACSTSLVAVHMAVRSLLAGECDLALAGGVSIPLPQQAAALAQPGAILSPDGRCRAFDAAAAGTVGGSGLGLVVLKRLADAERDGDRIHAVVRGSAINNDGAGKVGFTAPSIDGQREVIVKALRAAGVEPASIGYVEGHGTGTSLGDPIEVRALAEAFASGSEPCPPGSCVLSSVKSAVGHLDAAAGIAGLIKAVLAVREGRLPPTVHFQRPNPRLELESTPFVCSGELRGWPSERRPRRAGVSSFGIGGTNAHVVIEEPPPPPASSPPARPWQLVVLSGRAPELLAESAERLARHLEEHPEIALADAAATLRHGRRAFAWRRVAVGRSREEIAAELRAARTLRVDGEPPPVAFLFPGQGAQYPGMGQDLYDGEAVYRSELERCAELFASHLGRDLRELLGPEPTAAAAAELARTRWAQPALFAVEYALARQWQAWGIRPAAMLGHSIGEWVAATVAGVFSLADAVTLVARRAELMERLPAGAMLAVPLAAAELEPLLDDGVELAAVNAPKRSIASGTEAAVAKLEERLRARRIAARRLPVTRAFHSAACEPILDEFTARVRGCVLEAPEIPILSNVTGETLSAGEATDPGYWARQLRRPVRFAGGIGRLRDEPGTVLLEVGPGRTLATLARQHPAAKGAAVVHSLAGRGEDEVAGMLRALGRLWQAGVEVDWKLLDAGEKRRRVSLPATPLARRRYALARAAPAEPVPAPPPPVAAAATALTVVGEIVRAIRGEDLAADEIGVSFAEIGFDSLALIRLSEAVRRDLGIEIPFRRLLEELTTPAALAEYLDAEAPAPAPPPPAESVDDAELIRQIADVMAQLERLQQSLRERTAGARPAPTCRTPEKKAKEKKKEKEKEDQEELPLTESLKALWLAARFDENASRAYNEPLVLRLRGALEPAVVAGALAVIVRRHQALRAVFAADGESHRIRPRVAVTLPVVDLSALPAAARDSHEPLRQVATVTFDFTAGPLFRFLLVRCAGDDHLLAIVVHHLVIDGWSFGIVIRELLALCAAARRGEPARLGGPVCYADWVRRAAARETRPEDERYWHQRFADGMPMPVLPADRPRRGGELFAGARSSGELDAELTAGLRRLAGTGGTLNAVVLAGFAALLHRLTDQDELVVGLPSAGQSALANPTLVAYGIHMLPLRLRLAAGADFAGHLRQVRQLLLDGHDHRRYPLNRLVQALGLERDATRPGFFTTIFQLRRVRDPEAGGELDAELVPPPVTLVKSDLGLDVEDRGERLVVSFQYRRDLYDATTVRRWSEALGRLLAAAVRDPGMPVDELPLLSAAERFAVVTEWNDTAAAASESTLHGLVAAQAARSPRAIAVADGREELTFADLDRRANQVAHHLLALGVGPEQRVGVAVKPSAALVVALVGILKAGAAWVPLDPEHPAARRRQLAELSSATVVLTAAEVAAAVVRPASPPAVSVDPDQLAYVIFTSGSTGRPKGVMISHRAIVDRLVPVAGTGPRVEDRVLQHISPSFDASVWETFPPLVAGARLVSAPPGTSGNAERLAAVIAAERITVVCSLPTLLDGLLAVAGAERLASLRQVWVGGEVLPLGLPAHLGRLTGAELVNAYGPTEAAVIASCWRCALGGGRSSMPIGRPLANSRLLVLDRHLRPVPRGVSGELWIAGAGLARGYLDDPARTAAAFVPDPFAPEPGRRMYRSGDLVRRLAGGELEFLGRRDHQIKLRGIRIELGEIEAALGRLPPVAEVVAAVVDQRLVAWVVAAAPAVIDPAALRRDLECRLPAALVPAAFVVLDTMPRLPTGKIDRQALPAPADGERTVVAPRNPLERQLLAIWESLLEVRPIGVRDHFFELGGHSLIAVRVVSRIRRDLAVEIPPRVLFEAPTIELLARAVARRGAAGEALAEPIPPAPPDREIPLTFAQEWRRQAVRRRPDDPGHQLCLTLRVAGPLRSVHLARAVHQLVRRHEMLRTTFPDLDGRPRQVITAPPADVRVRVVDLTAVAAPEEEARLARREAERPFDVGCGPLWRLAVARRGAEEHWLLFTFHRLIVDGWSQLILIDELVACYAASIAGREPSLPVLPLRFADYAVWQRETEPDPTALDYWRRLLADLGPVRLGGDRRRGSSAGALLSRVLDGELIAALRQRSLDCGVTLYMTLLAGLMVLLRQLTGEDEIVVGTPAANRQRPELEGLIGQFFHFLVIRGALAGPMPVRELLGQIRQRTLEAFAHQALACERAVGVLAPDRDLEVDPLFHVLFALQNLPDPSRTEAFALSAVELVPPRATFDLELYVYERATGLRIRAVYAAELLSAEEVERLLDRYEHLLRAIAAGPELRLDELP